MAMQRFKFLFTLILFSPLAFLLGTSAHGQTGTPVFGQVVTSAGYPAASVPVRVCAITSSGIPCTPTSNIYSDAALTQQIGNPLSTDQYGNYTFFVGQGYYIVQITASSGVTYSYNIASNAVPGSYLPITGGTLTGGMTGTTIAATTVTGTTTNFTTANGTTLNLGTLNLTTGTVATLNAATVNTTLNAALQAGSDIGAKINTAYSGCSGQCTIYVPAGAYSFSTTINAPLNTYGTYGLTLDPGAVLTYTGSGDVIASQVNTYAITGSNRLVIQGGQIFCSTNSTTNGVHLYPGNSITVTRMLISGCNNGILVEGSDVVNIFDNEITGNNYGVQLISTNCNAAAPHNCSQTNTGGAVYSPNALHVHNNMMGFNNLWAIWDNGVLAPGTGSLNNSFAYNDFEQSGKSGGGTYGAVLIYKSVGDIVGPGNYFEDSPREVVLGQYTGGSGDYYAASSTLVIGNYFTTFVPIDGRTMSYNIELENAYHVMIEGNNEAGSPGISSSTNCYINAATGAENHTIIGINAILQNATTGSGNPTCVNGVASQLVGEGSYPIVNSNFQVYMAYQNWITAASATETVAVQNLTAGGSCFVTPVNAAALAQMGSSYISGIGAGYATFTHPATVNLRYNIFCVNNPN